VILHQPTRIDDNPHPPSIIVAIFSILPIPNDLARPLLILNVLKSILRPFSVICVPNGLRERTIYAPTFEPIPTNGLLSALSAAKRSHDSTIANDMKAYTRVKRNLCVVETWLVGGSGDAGDALQELMPLGGISDQKQEGFVLNPCWMRRLSSVSVLP
jgi:hypothetical protein